MKHKAFFIALLLCLAVGLSVTALAAEGDYDFFFKTPFAESGQNSDKMSATATPYVYPSVYSTITTYYLQPYESFVNGKVNVATNYVTTSEYGYNKFEYKEGYGGAGQSYVLRGMPGVMTYYTDYRVYGTWSA